MIHFFRKIRQQLITQNKVSKYLLYAVGEIVLVVIGILIALQINNWNESKKSILKTELLLAQLQKELALNIIKSNKVIEWYRNANSDLYNLITKRVTYDDYKSNKYLSQLLQGVEISQLEEQAFNNLIDNKGEFYKEQDSIISKLISLYKNDKKTVDYLEEIALSDVTAFIQELADTKVWYGDYVVLEEITDEIIEYFLNDPFYYNKLVNYERISLGEYLVNTILFRNKALQIYNELSDYLHLPKDSVLVKDLSKYEYYSGSYIDENNSARTFQIAKNKEYFVLKEIRMGDSAVIRRLNLYPDSKTTCIVGTHFGELIFDTKDQVTAFILARGTTRLVLKKTQ